MGNMQVRVDGIWASDIAPWGDLAWSTRWADTGGGCFEASWSMRFAPKARHRSIRRGRPVELFAGGVRIWKGTLTEPDWSTGRFEAVGLYQQAAGFLALDGSGNSTSVANTAVDNAISAGLPWSRPASLSSTALTTLTDNVNDLSQLLTNLGDRDGKRWMVDENGIVTVAADPTTPTWYLAPGVVELGQTDGDYASTLRIRYLDSSTSTYKTNTVIDSVMASLFGYYEAPVDLTGLGPITSTVATQYGNNILTKTHNRIGWTDSIDVSASQLTTANGVPADLSMVRAPAVVRAFDVRTPDRVLPYADLVLGQVEYTDGAETVRLSPVDKAPRTRAEIVEDITRAAKRRAFKG